jgi:type II secretory pathway pseudopilin PulG
MSIRSIFSNLQRFGRTFSDSASQRGFLTLELLISVFIMGALSTVVISANSSMSARLQTDNLAHLIALSIREAQTRALSATAPVGADTANEVPGYGVYISIADNTQIVPFVDTRSDAVNGIAYYPGASTPNAPKVLGQGYRISGISVVDAAGGTQIPEARSLSIYFHRPRPDADIFYGISPSNPAPTTPATQASIVIRSPKDGVTRTVTVTSTGQISVQ